MYHTNSVSGNVARTVSHNAAGTEQESNPMEEKTNFLMIVTDQHRVDYLGCYGHPLLNTPHINSIADRGTRFDKFYVTNPVCMPNRSSMITGRMTTSHGVRHNGLALCPFSNTFVELLRDAGYRTSLAGKSHLQPFSRFPAVLKRPEPRPGFHEPSQALQDALKPVPGAPKVDQELPTAWENGPDFLEVPFYGFEQASIATSHGDRVGGHYKHWLRERHPDPESLIGPENALAHDYVCPQAWRTAVPEGLYPTTFVADTALFYLQQHMQTTPGDPFFLMASFPDPHHPFTPPGKYWDMYDPDDVELPEDWDETPENLPPPLQWLYDRAKSGAENRSGQFAFSVNEREAREAIALTCGMISMIDDAVGRILDELDRLGLTENTVVIFTSDHGDLMGDHRLMLKGPLHYDGVIRVPMIWADPRAESQVQVSKELASTIDIAGSILERARIEP